MPEASKILDNMIQFQTTLSKSTPPTSLINCKTIDCLARYLGFPNYATLSNIVYPSTSKYYRRFAIPKKNGSFRLIEAPNKKLKGIQNKLSIALNELYKPRNSAHGFINKRSIITNALTHVNKSYVLNIDLENFFGTIHFGRVRNLFQSYPLNLSIEVATVLSHLCCLDGRLPQGAPTSPVISNMISYSLDKDLHLLAAKNRCTYTRYADDITFSFSQTRRKLPKSILTITKDSALILGDELKEAITNNGFSLSQTKTRVASQSERQQVTGLTVNTKLNVSRKFIRQTKSMLYAWHKFGPEAAENDYLKQYRSKSLSNQQLYRIDKEKKKGCFFKQVVKGRIDFIKMTRGSNDLIYRKIAYKYSELIGKPNPDLINTPLDIIGQSIFIIENNVDCSQGTAFLLENIGLVTNQHVVNNIDEYSSDQLEIYRHHETENKLQADFIKACKIRDLAILSPSASFKDINQLTIGDDSKLKVGDKITIIGFPQYSKGETPYINTGKIIQSKRHFNQTVWLVDNPIIHGNSGGPVLNDKNEVIGIASIGSAKHDHSTKFHGFIPISTLIKYFKED